MRRNNGVLLFAGTSEGRDLALALEKRGIPVTVSVATEYGRDLLPKEGMEILTGRMDFQQIAALLREGEFSWVVDATHPYAALVTENISAACKAVGAPYLRLLRENLEESGCVSVNSPEEAAAFLAKAQGNILLTTGSKELEAFTKALPAQRLYVRVLPVAEVVEKCRALGLEGSHLCCMQGPFSEAFNRAMLEQWDIAWLVTKETGRAGGFEEKLNAASALGVGTLVIGRPDQLDGLSYGQVLDRLVREFQK